MDKANFKKYLAIEKVEENVISKYIENLEKYEYYLSTQNQDLETSAPENIVEYTDYLVSRCNNDIMSFLRTIIHYANYTKRYELITKVIDISESYNAMENLNERVAEFYGENVRNEIFRDLTIPPLGINPEKKPDFTKVILTRLEEKLGKKEIINIFSPCLHGRPPDDIEGDKKLLRELGIDGFLEKKHQDLVNRLENHKNDGTLEFAQEIDEEIVNYVKNHRIMGVGVRKGDKIHISKIPYQMRSFLDSNDDNFKRFFICYCPWIRSAIKNGDEKGLIPEFCHCSAGWYKLYWDQIFDDDIVVDPIKTAMNGDLECTFAVHIPQKVLKSELNSR